MSLVENATVANLNLSHVLIEVAYTNLNLAISLRCVAA